MVNSWSMVGHVVIGALTVTAFVLVLTTIQRDAAAVAPNTLCTFATSVAEEAQCDDNRTCTRDVALTVDGTVVSPLQCRHLPLPRTQACTNSCYLPHDTMACDGYAGICVGDEKSCRGSQCMSDGACGSLIPLDTQLIGSIGDGFDYLPLFTPPECLLGRCVLHAVTVAYTSVIEVGGGGADGPLTGPHAAQSRIPCLRFVRPSTMDLYGECLTSTFTLLDTNLSVYQSNDTGTAQINDVYGNTERPVQLGVCSIYFSCSVAVVRSEMAYLFDNTDVFTLQKRHALLDNPALSFEHVVRARVQHPAFVKAVVDQFVTT